VTVRKIVRHGPEGLPEQAFYAITLDRSTNLASYGHTEARLGIALVLAREGVHDEVAVRVRTAFPVDAIELGAAGQALAPGAAPAAACAGRVHRYGVSRLRPLSRRRFNIERPARVRMRARNPWVLARLRFFG
jgi:hypothetical protein